MEQYTEASFSVSAGTFIYLSTCRLDHTRIVNQPTTIKHAEQAARIGAEMAGELREGVAGLIAAGADLAKHAASHSAREVGPVVSLRQRSSLRRERAHGHVLDLLG